jgi:hypothetical protein
MHSASNSEPRSCVKHAGIVKKGEEERIAIEIE